jgi:hypothetical protein
LVDFLLLIPVFYFGKTTVKSYAGDVPNEVSQHQ